MAGVFHAGGGVYCECVTVQRHDFNNFTGAAGNNCNVLLPFITPSVFHLNVQIVRGKLQNDAQNPDLEPEAICDSHSCNHCDERRLWRPDEPVVWYFGRFRWAHVVVIAVCPAQKLLFHVGRLHVPEYFAVH